MKAFTGTCGNLFAPLPLAAVHVGGDAFKLVVFQTFTTLLKVEYVT